jgi:tetratricopeptide (TPR) repeat protein
MGRFTAYLIERFSQWSRASRQGFVIALVLLLPSLMVATTGPQNLRGPATIAVIGISIVMQVIFMWENRGMVTDYTRAQRAFRQGDFEQARDLLESSIRNAKTVDVQELTLLGNTYRMLGALDKSANVLSEALNIVPDAYFPLYGFGRTLMMQGDYAAAIDAITQALDNGAPAVTRYDLGEAYYRNGQAEAALDAFDAVWPDLSASPQELHRLFMAQLIQARLTDDALPEPSPDVIAHWREIAALCADTPYGQAVADDLATLSARA